MRKFWIFTTLLSALVLSACSQATPVPATPVKATSTSAPAQAAQPSGPTMQCQVVSLSPTQGPTEASMFPPVSSDDWVLGDTQDPAMTIIEYSDFQ